MRKQREDLTELSVLPFIEATSKCMQMAFVYYCMENFEKNGVNYIHVFNLSSYGTSYGAKRKGLEPKWSESQSSLN